jgi:7-cyano-7-deazaguanine synthase
MVKRVVVLHSGGMDSTVCLYQAKADGQEVYSVGIDYNQRLFVELLYAARQCEQIGVPRELIKVNWRKPERSIPLGRHVDEMRSSVSPAFLPGRNAVFLTLATAHAAGLGADEVHIGLNCVDFSGYPDCTPEFFDAASTMLNRAIPDGPKLVSPLLLSSKREIAQKAYTLGIGKNDTWSCYRPQVAEVGIVPCNECDACVLHEHAWDFQR